MATVTETPPTVAAATSATPTPMAGPVRLSFARGRVCIPAGDAERYLRVVESARPTVPADLPRRPTWEFEAAFLCPVRAWCEARKDKVRACYAPPPGEVPMFYILTKCEGYDEQLNRDLGELELSFRETHWRLFGRLISAGRDVADLGNWFKLEEAIEIYADGEPARGEGDAEPGVPGDDRRHC